MDALQISGKWYISTRRAAKEHGYHADYIGQLIRSGKVKGQKVGRSWYAMADSLSEYLEAEKKSLNSVLGRRKHAKKQKTPATISVQIEQAEKEENTSVPAEVESESQVVIPSVAATETVQRELPVVPKPVATEVRAPLAAAPIKQTISAYANKQTIVKESKLLTYLPEEEKEIEIRKAVRIPIQKSAAQSAISHQESEKREPATHSEVGGLVSAPSRKAARRRGMSTALSVGIVVLLGLSIFVAAAYFSATLAL